MLQLLKKELTLTASPLTYCFLSFSAMTMIPGYPILDGKNCPESKELAEMLQKTITGYLQPENTREIKQATKDIYILYQATKPAVMVECGFLSNAAEADKLTDEEYQDQIAFSICTALMNCLADQS